MGDAVGSVNRLYERSESGVQVPAACAVRRQIWLRARAPDPVTDPDATCTPGAWPASTSARLFTGAVAVRCAALMLLTVLPSSTRRASPVAVVTTSASLTTTADNTKSSVAV